MDVKDKRKVIIDFHKQGLIPAQIFKKVHLLQFSRQFIQRTVKRFVETYSINDRPRTGRTHTGTKPSMVKKIRERIRRNPKQSMRKIAKDLGISEFSIRQVVHGVMGMRPYKLQKEQSLTTNHIAKRLSSSTTLKKRFKNGTRLAALSGTKS